MRETKDFLTKKNIYIGTVLNHVPYRKLHPRIYEDISSHMDDMYEDMQSECLDEQRITEKIIGEMGDPDELGKELQKTHAPDLLRAKINKTIITILICILSPFIVFYVCDGIADFINSYSVKGAEEWLNEHRTDGGEVKLLYEFEHDGVIHKFYAPEIQDESFRIYHINSIKLFGFNSKTRFDISFHSYLLTESFAIIDIDPDTIALNDSVIILFDNPKEKYIKVRYIPTGDEAEGYWSDYIQLPQNGTMESPINMFIDCPDGYRWKVFEGFDSEKSPVSRYDFYLN